MPNLIQNTEGSTPRYKINNKPDEFLDSDVVVEESGQLAWDLDTLVGELPPTAEVLEEKPAEVEVKSSNPIANIRAQVNSAFDVAELHYEVIRETSPVLATKFIELIEKGFDPSVSFSKPRMNEKGEIAIQGRGRVKRFSFTQINSISNDNLAINNTLHLLAVFSEIGEVLRSVYQNGAVLAINFGELLRENLDTDKVTAEIGERPVTKSVTTLDGTFRIGIRANKNFNAGKDKQLLLNYLLSKALDKTGEALQQRHDPNNKEEASDIYHTMSNLSKEIKDTLLKTYNPSSGSVEKDVTRLKVGFDSVYRVVQKYSLDIGEEAFSDIHALNRLKEEIDSLQYLIGEGSSLSTMVQQEDGSMEERTVSFSSFRTRKEIKVKRAEERAVSMILQHGIVVTPLPGLSLDEARVKAKKLHSRRVPVVNNMEDKIAVAEDVWASEFREEVSGRKVENPFVFAVRAVNTIRFNVTNQNTPRLELVPDVHATLTNIGMTLEELVPQDSAASIVKHATNTKQPTVASIIAQIAYCLGVTGEPLEQDRYGWDNPYNIDTRRPPVALEIRRFNEDGKFEFEDDRLEEHFKDEVLRVQGPWK